MARAGERTRAEDRARWQMAEVGRPELVLETRVYRVPSASEPGTHRRVELAINGAGVRATCDCPAGQAGRECWHAAAALMAFDGRLDEGEPVRLVPAPADDEGDEGISDYLAEHRMVRERHEARMERNRQLAASVTVDDLWGSRP